MYNLHAVLFDFFKDTSATVPLAIGVILLLVVSTFVVACLRVKSLEKYRNVVLKDPNTTYTVSLIEKEELNHDTRRLRFGLPSSNHVLGLQIGQHIHLSFRYKDDLVTRPYSPISSGEEKGYFELIIKVYDQSKFRKGGTTSKFLDNMKKGDKIGVMGPFGRLQYVAPGTLLIKETEKDRPVKILVNRINMIAGGVGITPMLQLVRQICKDANDLTELRLLFANQTEEDIILRNELENYQREYTDQFKLWYTLDKAPEGWLYSTGFISEKMIREKLFPPEEDVFVLMCGPPTMINQAIKPALKTLGYKHSMCFSFS